MSARRPKKRSKKSTALVEGDLDGAEAFTHVTVTTITRSGATITKEVLVPLVPVIEERDNTPFHAEEPIDFAGHSQNIDYEQPDPPRARRTQRDYVKQFVDRVGDLLQASLSRETWPEHQQRCMECPERRWSVWRCIDCTLSRPVCRRCMRHTHTQSPFHRIERWTGDSFRRAALWEVGTYVLVPHDGPKPICEGLEFQRGFLERLQINTDNEEDLKLGQMRERWTSASASASASSSASGPDEDAKMGDVEQDTWEQDNLSDTEFFKWLDASREQAEEVLDEFMDGEDAEDGERAEQDVRGFHPYLGAISGTGVHNADADADRDLDTATEVDAESHTRADADPAVDVIMPWTAPRRPGADALNNTYVRPRRHGPGGIPTTACKLYTHSNAVHGAPHGLFSALQSGAQSLGLTRPIGNSEIVNLYNEFRRMSRLWRWMKKLKWAGYGHNKQDPLNPPAGSLANFCPTCPQPGRNLPQDWKNDPNRWVFRVLLAGDGNFKADHVRQKKDADVWLIDGGGMFPKRDHYFAFLARAIERFTKAPCENTFRAIQNALLASKACDLTGVVAMCCARHGCFVPNLLVDLFKGEQQKNVDFSFLQALTIIGIEIEQGVMLIYDIVCQYIIHLLDRIGVHLPTGLTIERAIDHLHVHAHKDDCFYRFITTFIPGAAICAGQILESLWSNLNAILPTVRTATLPHRAEMLDDHCCDSNHKKMLAMTETLCSRHVTATATVSKSDAYFLNISSTVDAATQVAWEAEVKAAEANRAGNVQSMDVYAARVDDRLGVDMASASASSTASVSSTASAAAPGSPIELWMEYALVVEETQIDIQDRVRRLGAHPDQDDLQLVERKRQTLTAMLVKLKRLQDNARVNGLSGGYEPAVEDNEGRFDEIGESPDDADANANADGDARGQHARDSRQDLAAVEREVLTLPSNGNVAGDMGELEIRERVKQARRHINRLRDLIADISFQYSHVIRNAPRKSNRTAAQKREILRVFRVLTREDLKASTEVLRPNEQGSSSVKLSWIWRTGCYHLFRPNEEAGTDAESHAENVRHPDDADADPATLLEFKRVHWLRARALNHRWHKEVVLVTYEMQWTVRYFLHQCKQWQEGADNPDVSAGARSYAVRQIIICHHYIINELSIRYHRSSYLHPSPMADRQIRLFSVFSLQLGADAKLHSRLQEILWYAESQFRQALLVIHTAADRHQKWMQSALQDELKFVLMVVGQAAAVGLAINVPILVRSLADSLMSRGPPLQFHKSMLAALDNGLDAEHPCALVPKYACDWWNADAEPNTDKILGFGNISELLACHQNQHPFSAVPHLPPFPALDTATGYPPCTDCQKYCDVASDAVAELEGVLKYAEATHVSAEASWAADMRRAQGFYLLHESIIKKELQESTASASNKLLGPTKIGDVSVNRKSRRVHTNAHHELERLKQLPVGSYKWTWGPELSPAEVKGLLPPPGDRKPPHSGYDESLPEGPWRNIDSSAAPTMPKLSSGDAFSTVSANIDVPPMPESDFL
ncbi:hypothetical protein B0H34DRAFT_858828 [Crassisporium funariophilum]|nr:hypothetical protein B0H34DRAFT_858828 [Crassisporium funariophilum]